MFSMMFHRLMWTNFVYYILAIRLFSAYLWIWHRIFRTLLILYNCRYQTHKRNITKFYLLIPKHHIIQLPKLQVCILNISTTIRLCSKNSDYFWTRVYRAYMVLQTQERICNALHTIYNCNYALRILENCYSHYAVHKDNHLNEPSS